MSTTLTTRLPDALLDEIERISEEEQLDKSAVARRLLEQAVREHRLASALEAYRDGELTLRGAAAEAGVPLRQLLAELDRHEVPVDYGLEDLEEDLAGPADG